MIRIEIIEHFFQGLRGRWDLNRTITEPNQTSTFMGTALFTAETPTTYFYEENGTLSFADGTTLAGTQNYAYHWHGDTLSIDFRDRVRHGQRYVDLVFHQQGDHFVAAATHACAPDLYQHHMTWISATAFTTEITVKGPRKNYVMKSTYGR